MRMRTKNNNDKIVRYELNYQNEINLTYSNQTSTTATAKIIFKNVDVLVFVCNLVNRL